MNYLNLSREQLTAKKSELEKEYSEILSKGLKVIDTAAAAIAMDNGLKTLLFAAEDPENVVKVLAGEKLGTIVK